MPSPSGPSGSMNMPFNMQMPRLVHLFNTNFFLLIVNIINIIKI
jgi:hypothetical protein